MNEKGVSAVIGVLLLVAVVVLFGATIWYYISGLVDERLGTNLQECHTGMLQDKFREGTEWIVYYFVINNQDFRVNETTFYNYEIGDYHECKI